MATEGVIPRSRSPPKREVDAERGRKPTPSPSSPVAISAMDVRAEFSTVFSTPPPSGPSRPESSLSVLSSPRNLSGSSSVLGRDSSLENAAITQHYMDAYRELPPSSAGNSVPQLIMPNLQIPRRRPFTDVGRSIGKLRLLVLGSRGTGKTSIIRSIAQCCEHIVHIDAISARFDAPILEIYASTRPYQWWRTETSPKALTRRRCSASVEEILDRNISFLDFTPLGSSSIQNAVDFLESTLSPLLQKQMANADLISLLSNGSEPVVDAVLYMLSPAGMTESDAVALKQVQKITNILPLLARSDELDDVGVLQQKKYLREQIKSLGIDVFSFSPPQHLSDESGVFAVSNVTAIEDDVIDASILMNSEYIEPLKPTDLGTLVNSIFCLEGAARLRHSAAVKAVKWINEQSRHHSFDSALTRRRLNSAALSTATIDPFFQAHERRRLQACSWAQSLRQSLDYGRIIDTRNSSRIANELIARSSGTVARRHRGDNNALKRRRRQVHTYDQDPLGLVRLAAEVKKTGALAIELIGGIGVISYVALFVLRPEFADRNVRFL